MERATFAFLFLLTIATAANCGLLAEQGKLADAGDCYSDQSDWAKCMYYYLETAREAELKWDRNAGDFSQKSIALYYYNPKTPKVQKCLSNYLRQYEDSELKSQLTDYVDWLTYYSTNPIDPPFDMTEVIDRVKANAFPVVVEESPQQPEEEEQVTEQQAPEEEKQSPPPTTQTEEQEQPQEQDNTMLYLGALLVAAVVIAIVFFVKGKPEKPEKEEKHVKHKKKKSKK
ncbi:MAG: hypothetical protein J7K68_04320 [Candidatus Diapherotrites archaeon]|nr:hypothetical protein [Candidatus Diapherotrites archaeon]